MTPHADFQHTVQQIFAELTRYPIEILDPYADLEDDLGIDSVKRAEILAVFGERFELPMDMEVPPESLTTIAGIADVLRPIIERARASAPSQGNGHSTDVTTRDREPQPAHADRPPPQEPGIQQLVIDVFAEVTGYPREILTLEARFEDDLGIDETKRAQALALLHKRLSARSPNRPVPSDVETLGDLIAAVEVRHDHGTGAVYAPPPLKLDAVEGGVGAVNLPGRIGRGQTAHWASFAGKLAFVSGAGHGIGQVIATRLAERGAHVIVNSFHSRDRGEQVTAAIRAAGGHAEHLWGSVANPTHVQRMFGAIEQQFGHLDFLVANASNGIVAPLSAVTEHHWDRAFRTNVLGLHQCAVSAIPLMKERGGGKIVTISSPGAHRYIEYFGCMGPIKAAVESLTLYLAIELAPHNIQVNCVSAGPVYGELLSHYPNAERLIPYWESLSANRQLGTEPDIADFVMLLLSQASDKITGSTMLVDNGGSQRI